MSSKRDQDREVTRRALIKWSLAAGAALGVSRSGILEVLDRSAGRGIAEAAAVVATKRSVHIRAGAGGLAWFQLLWPHNDIAAAANNTVAWHQPANTRMAPGTDRPLTISSDSPFDTFEGRKQMSCFMAGSNEAHVNNPNSIVRSVNGSSMFAIAAALQSTNASVVPVITVDDVALGTAPGAPRAAVVPTGDDIVGLFNSAASRAGQLLETTSHADLYRAHYTTLAGLNRAAQRSTNKLPYATGRSAASFLGTNLESQLRITAADLTRYGIDASMRSGLVEIGRTLIVAAKAFASGLTSSVILPGLRDDPHQAFNDMTSLAATTRGYKKILDGFMTDLATKTDSLTGKPLSESIVMTIEGDTPKTPLDRANWLDDTPGNSNWVYVYGGGKLKTGWFGGIARNGTVTGFDPATGASAPYQGDVQARAAVAAVAYAITNGDTRRVGDFTNADITGIVV